MIIMVRGNHGSGKSTAVRSVLKALHAEVPQRPRFGILGLRMPEAYQCSLNHGTRAVHVLGPYESSVTSGCDYVTKLGVTATCEFLERYRQKGDILFESIMTSVRILEPSIGRWIKAHKDEMVITTLTTTFEECIAAIEDRRTRSMSAHRFDSKHLKAQQIMFERVTAQYTEADYRMEYVSRDDAPGAIMRWLKEK